MSPRTATAAKPAAEQKPATVKPSTVQPGGNLPAAGTKPPHPVVAFKNYMDDRMGEVALALPPHMTAERFGRVVLTALQRTPKLLACTKQSLFNSCMMAAQDGLLPDGREGAIVPYADGKADQAQWMPMIEGLRKKARNSGEISNWEVHIVRARDLFEVVLGDNPRIDHKPYFGAEDPGEIIGAYSIAWLKDGTISRDVMTIRDIQKIKAVSKAQKGPWSNPTFFPEMCKKTVARRHYKQLPHAAELDEFIKRLDEREGLADDADRIESRARQRVASTAAAFDEFSRAPVIEHEEPTGTQDDPPAGDEDISGEFEDEVTKPAAETQQPAGDAAGVEQVDEKPEPETTAKEPEKEPDQTATTWPANKEPKNEDEYQQYAKATVAAMTVGGEIAEWFKGEAQRKLRNKCGVTKDAFDAVKLMAANRISSLKKA